MLIINHVSDCKTQFLKAVAGGGNRSPGMCYLEGSNLL